MSRVFFFSPARSCAVCSLLSAMVLAGTVARAQNHGASPYVDASAKASSDDITNARGYANVGFNPDIMSVPGRPFTATRVYSERLAPAGSAEQTPPRTVEVIIARDKQGRVHYESTTPSGGPIGVIIYDPVAHTLSEYSTTPEGGMPEDAVATVTRLNQLSEGARPTSQASDESAGLPAELNSGSVDASPAAVAAPAPASSAQKLPAPNDLPARSINGVQAVGYRTVQKYGDRQQFFMIQEDWFSPEYAVNVRQEVLRQNQLESSVETRDLAAGDPDPDLFRVPGGYVVKMVKTE